MFRAFKNVNYLLTHDKFLSKVEVDSLEVVLHRNLKIEQHSRDALLVALALHTGGRAREILNLKSTDLNPIHNSVLLSGIKGSASREVPLPNWVFRPLKTHARNLNPGDLIFDISYNRLRQIWLLWRPAKKKFHSLRHTFAVRTYVKTKDIRLLQLALGHKSIVNTMIYVDYVYKTTEMRRLIQTGNEKEY